MSGNDQAKLMTVHEVANLLGLSERQVWKLDTGRHLPAPVRVGHGVGWRRQELLGWIAGGTPARDDWERRSRTGPASKSSVSGDPQEGVPKDSELPPHSATHAPPKPANGSADE